MPRVTIYIENTTTSPPPVVRGDESGSPVPEGASGIVFHAAGWIPADQDYYWSEQWQSAELETLASLAMGDGIRFDTAADLLDWLHSDDED